MSGMLANIRKQRYALRDFILPCGIILLCGMALFSGLLAPERVMAQTDQAVDTSAQNLMVVLRETIGANKQDEALEPIGKMRFRMPDGKHIDLEIAAFALLGDMHIRFVFDGPNYMRNATPQDL